MNKFIANKKEQKKEIEARTIRIRNQGQRNTRCLLRTFFFLVYFVYAFVYVNNVNFVYVEHPHLWSLNIFCNLLLQNKQKKKKTPSPDTGCQVGGVTGGSFYKF